ncbi:MAG: hypothetical protein HRT88_07340, partial [Lentisphaeraceae bacterium]|nr:hypothetical protein [Lentisphaeraceae bacterium]
PTLSEVDIVAYSRGTIAREIPSNDYMSTITPSDYNQITDNKLNMNENKHGTANNDLITIKNSHHSNVGTVSGGDGDDIIYIEGWGKAVNSSITGDGGTNILVINADIFASSNSVNKITFRNGGNITYNNFDQVIINTSANEPTVIPSTLTRIDSVLYTNHLLSGRFDKLLIHGSMISQHRKLMGLSLTGIYDIRARTSVLSDYLPIANEGPQTRYHKEL